MAGFKVFVNFKTYPQGTGEKAVGLAKICEEVATEKKLEIIPIVQTVGLFRIKQQVGIPIWVQHLDWQPSGQATGWINLEGVVEAGACGTLLNHSEHQIPPGTIKQAISRIKNLKFNPPAGGENFNAMVCCKTLGQMERLVKLKPDFIGYEISELIGGKMSITEYNPKAIKHAVQICQGIPLIVGAGINQNKDVLRAKELGAEGVLISSAVVLAEDPKQKLLELTYGL